VRKNRWATAEGRVVSARFKDVDYNIVIKRANARGISVSEYIKFLVRYTSDDGYNLRVLDWLFELEE